MGCGASTAVAPEPTEKPLKAIAPAPAANGTGPSDDDAQRQAAAAKIEAIARGRAARRNNSPAPAAAPASASSTPASVTPSRRASDQPRKSNTGFFDQLGEASTRAAAAVQAHARGRLQRLEAERMAAAATRVQARYRGRSAQLAVEERRVEVQVTTTAELKHDRDENVKKVNAYGIGKQLGKGSFGTVYKGTKGGDDFALKVLKRSLLKRKRMGRTGNAFEAVLREIAVMKKLHHPNVVKLYEVIDDPERDELYLVLEFVEGGDLMEPIRKKEVVPEDTLRLWTRDLLLGLEHLHLSGVCHRDVKPENVLWDKRAGRAKLADFGVSTIMRSQGLGGDILMATGGTVPFFAPEMCSVQSRQGGYSGKAADLWACGVCLFMWRYHRLPFAAPTELMMMEAIRDTPLEWPDDADATAELKAVLRGLLEKLPKQRWRMRELRRDMWITSGGTSLLPITRQPTGAEQTVSTLEFQSAISQVILNARAMASMKGGLAAAPSSEPSPRASGELSAGEAITEAAVETGAAPG